MTAVNQYGWTLQFASKDLEKLNRPWNWNGWKLQDASEYLKRDSEIVMAAVKQYGNALEFASEDL